MSEQDCKKEGLTVFYDGACPICSREINLLKKKDIEATEYQDINDPNFDPSKLGLTHKDLDAKIHATTEEGELVSGMEVFRRIYAKTKYSWLIGITGLPIIKQIFDLFYAIFAKNRHKISRIFAKLIGS